MKKILIVYANYYPNISKSLKLNSEKILKREKVRIKSFQVTGVFEIPIVLSKYIKKYDAFIAIGIIIKGETPNFNLISQAITNGIMDLSILHKKPIGNAILTCLTSAQVKKRINKGKEAVEAVLDVLNPNDNYSNIEFKF